MLRVCGNGCEIRCFTLSFLLFSPRYLARPRGSRAVTVSTDSVSVDPMPAESVDLCDNELSPLVDSPPSPLVSLEAPDDSLGVAGAGDASAPLSDSDLGTGDDLSPRDENDIVETSISPHANDSVGVVGVNPPSSDDVGPLAESPASLPDEVPPHLPPVNPPGVIMEVLDEGFVPGPGGQVGGVDADAPPFSPESSQSVLPAAPMEVAASESVVQKRPLSMAADSGELL